MVCIDLGESPGARIHKPPDDLPLGVRALDRARDRYPWLEMLMPFPFDEAGIEAAVAEAMAMRTVKSAIDPAAAGASRP